MLSDFSRGHCRTGRPERSGRYARRASADQPLPMGQETRPQSRGGPPLRRTATEQERRFAPGSWPPALQRNDGAGVCGVSRRAAVAAAGTPPRNRASAVSRCASHRLDIDPRGRAAYGFQLCWTPSCRLTCSSMTACIRPRTCCLSCGGHGRTCARAERSWLMTWMSMTGFGSSWRRWRTREAGCARLSRSALMTGDRTTKGCLGIILKQAI